MICCLQITRLSHLNPPGPSQGLYGLVCSRENRDGRIRAVLAQAQMPHPNAAARGDREYSPECYVAITMELLIERGLFQKVHLES